MTTDTVAIRREVSELALLYEISEILDRSVDLRDELGPVLKVIAKHTGMLRGTISLLNRDMDEIVICAAHGLSPEQLQRGRYRLGEGVVGKVVQTGRPVIIPSISQEPMFLNRTHARGKTSSEKKSLISAFPSKWKPP